MSGETVSGVRLDNLALDGRYLTPVSTPTDYVCRRIFIPDDIRILAAIDELIGVATNPDVWEQSTGGITALEAAALVGEVFMWEGCMLGAIMPYIGDNPPAGMLAMDGSIYSGDDYPKLYAIIPATWKLTGVDFYLPDMADSFVVGAGNLYPVDSTGGEDVHTLTEAEMPGHSHTTQPHDHGYTSPLTSIDTVGELPGIGLTGTLPATTTSSGVTVDSTGGDQPHNNLPPYRAFRFGIVAK